MFNEIKHKEVEKFSRKETERIVQIDKEESGYKQIKPETNISVEECHKFLDNLFN